MNVRDAHPCFEALPNSFGEPTINEKMATRLRFLLAKEA
jgi:hypothetical protein